MEEIIKGTPIISSEILTSFIESLSDNFYFNVNDQFKRVAIYYAEKLICSYPFGEVPKDNVYSYKGSLQKRGYQAILQIIWNQEKQGMIHLGYDSRKKLVKILEKLEIYKNPIDYTSLPSQENLDIQKKRELLQSKYGVGVHEKVYYD